MRKPIILLLVALGFGGAGCTPPAPKPAPEIMVTVTGVVTDQADKPVAHARIVVDGKSAGETSDTGAYVVRHAPTAERLPVNFSAPGYVATTRVLLLPKTGERGASPTVLLARARPSIIDADRGGQMRFPGGTLSAPAGAFVDGSGARVHGPVNVSVTPFDVADAGGMRAAPGDFRALGPDRKEIRLHSFGMFDIAVTDAQGHDLALAPGVSLPFTLRAPKRVGDRAPIRSGLYWLDPATGYWINTGVINQVEPLVYSGTVTRVGYSWNVDDPTTVTCITVKVVRIDPITQVATPVNNAEVRAEGVNYLSVSTGYTNANGLVCLLVMRNELVSLSAYQQVGTSTWMSPNNPVITSPNVQAGAADCGDPTLCPLVATVPIDLIVGLRAKTSGSGSKSQ